MDTATQYSVSGALCGTAGTQPPAASPALGAQLRARAPRRLVCGEVSATRLFRFRSAVSSICC